MSNRRTVYTGNGEADFFLLVILCMFSYCIAKKYGLIGLYFHSLPITYRTSVISLL